METTQRNSVSVETGMRCAPKVRLRGGWFQTWGCRSAEGGTQTNRECVTYFFRLAIASGIGAHALR